MTGSRSFGAGEGLFLNAVMKQYYGLFMQADIRHGGAKGFDRMAGEWIATHCGVMPVVVKPDYKRYEPALAPLERNIDMVRWAARGVMGIVLAMLPVGATINGRGGTAHTIRHGIDEGLQVHVYRFSPIQTETS